MVFFSHGAHKADADPGGLLHHIPHLSGELHLAFARHHVHLNLQRIASHAGPGKPPDNPGLRLFIRFVQTVFSFS